MTEESKLDQSASMTPPAAEAEQQDAPPARDAGGRTKARRTNRRSQRAIAEQRELTSQQLRAALPPVATTPAGSPASADSSAPNSPVGPTAPTVSDLAQSPSSPASEAPGVQNAAPGDSARSEQVDAAAPPAVSASADPSTTAGDEMPLDPRAQALAKEAERRLAHAERVSNWRKAHADKAFNMAKRSRRLRADAEEASALAEHAAFKSALPQPIRDMGYGFPQFRRLLSIIAAAGLSFDEVATLIKAHMKE